MHDNATNEPYSTTERGECRRIFTEGAYFFCHKAFNFIVYLRLEMEFLLRCIELEEGS